jgi:hypothetical protein
MFDTSKLKALAEAATPGPWTAYDTHGKRFIESMAGEMPVCSQSPKKQWLKDSDFISAANPFAVLGLIAEVELLRAEVEALRQDAELWESIHDEIHRRADKEHALADRCDFDVTIMYEDYAAIDEAIAGGGHAGQEN